MAVSKALMALRVVMCQNSTGSAGVRYAASRSCHSRAHAPTAVLEKLPLPHPFRTQGVLCQELRGTEGGKREVAHPAARGPGRDRQGHCGLRWVEHIASPAAPIAYCPLTASFARAQSLVSKRASMSRGSQPPRWAARYPRRLRLERGAQYVRLVGSAIPVGRCVIL